MSETKTAENTKRVWLCSCCVKGGCGDDDQLPLSTEWIVTCSDCHQPCSCQGCIADEEAAE